MSVMIRLSRFGRLHKPLFRVVAIDKRCHREGMANEIVGAYDPQAKDKNLQVDIEKVAAWVQRGARISTGLVHLLKHYGYAVPGAAAPAASAAKPKRHRVKGDGKAFVKATLRQRRRHAARVKTVRKAEAAKAAAAKAAETPAEAPKA